MQETVHTDPHESMADTAACGLAAALLLLFSILTATRQAQGTMPAQMQLTVTFTFDQKNLPSVGSTATAAMNGELLCMLAVNGELQPGTKIFRKDAAMPDINTPRSVFANQTALFGTRRGERPAITFSADRLSDGKVIQKSWATRLSIQFAKKPQDVEIVWTFSPGFAVDSLRTELFPAAEANHGPPIVEELKLEKRSGVRIMTGTSTIAMSEI